MCLVVYQAFGRLASQEDVYKRQDQHDYETDKPSMVEIRPGHFVWANQAELERYKKDMN